MKKFLVIKLAWRAIRASLTSLIVIAAAVAHAQSPANYDLSWNTISGGGESLAAEQFSLSGTIGEPDAAISACGDMELVGGFWSPEAPLLCSTLTITHSGNQVIISWPSWAFGCVLRWIDKPGTASSWSNVSVPVVQVGNKFTVTLPASAAKRFFELLCQY